MTTMELRIEALRRAFEAVLDAESLEWDRDADNDLRFKVGSTTFFLLFDQQDPMYLRMILPRFFAVPQDPSDLNRAYRICNVINNRIKLARVNLQPFDVPHRQEAVAIVEFLVNRVDEIQAVVLMRMIACLRNAAQAYVQELMHGE